ncbi:MAG: glycoside hydrolase [Planctomycetes bacterium]|nr:glycoside hydrolase [Planctomycetota bacterium]
MRKLHDIVIYSDDRFYSAFPSIVCRPDGELLVAFRRAPDRRPFFAPHVTHADPNSYLVLVRSGDGGNTWSREPELIYAHPMGGSQDPCMVQLDDRSLVVTSYAWMLLPQEGVSHQTNGMDIRCFGWNFTFLGGYLMRSTDGARSWHGPILPPQIAGQATYFPGVPIPAMNRGALTQGRDGHLYWAVARSPADNPKQTALDLLVSRDRGLTWAHAGPIASDPGIVFNEASLIETPRGDLVAFIRTAGGDLRAEGLKDHGVVARSQDYGRTWEWHDMGIVGHPYHATRLPDGRVFLIYGYRHPPFGVRARVLDAECRDFSSPEIVLRDDGGNYDLGYPWSCLTADGKVLAVYYFNRADGTRHIAGTFLEC